MFMYTQNNVVRVVYVTPYISTSCKYISVNIVRFVWELFAIDTVSCSAVIGALFIYSVYLSAGSTSNEGMDLSCLTETAQVMQPIHSDTLPTPYPISTLTATRKYYPPLRALIQVAFIGNIF